MSERRITLEKACSQFEPDLVLYYYGEGSEPERRRVETHLNGCPRCVRFMDDLHALLPQMSKNAELPQSFWDNYYREMVQKLEAIQEPKAWWRYLVPTFGGWAIPAFGTAAVAVLAIALVFGKVHWGFSSRSTLQEGIPQEILSDSGRLEFFKSLDLLESLSTLEKMDGSTAEKGELQSL